MQEQERDSTRQPSTSPSPVQTRSTEEEHETLEAVLLIERLVRLAANLTKQLQVVC